jgi:hypothetical protein
MPRQTIHFHSGDGRFCGSTKQMRRFTMDENEVTCRACKGKGDDRLTLTAQGSAFVAEHPCGSPYTSNARAVPSEMDDLRAALRCTPPGFTLADMEG